VVDSDVNDPSAPFTANDMRTSPQSVPVPVTIGGYVNVAGAGADGRSKANGDKSDTYRISAIAGQVASLNISDVDGGDPDLYLYDSTGATILASSLGTDSYEQVKIATTGTYLLVVEAFDGASNYVLTVGAAPPVSSSVGALSTDLELIPGQAIVRLKDEAGVVSQKAVTDMSAAHAFTVRAGAVKRDMLVSLQSPSVSGYSEKAVFPAGTSDRLSQFASEALRLKWETLMAIKALRRDPRTQYAEPNLIVRPTFVPNDTYYQLQWHYPLINLPAAQDITRGSSAVIVAVVDTGVVLRHPDLQGQLIAGYDFIADPSVARDGNGIDSNPDDVGDGSPGDVFHGTHVTGTIAAASNNAIGVAGVAPLVKIMPVRVLSNTGGSNYDVIQGVRYAAGLSNDSGTVPAKRADVINLSLGRSGSPSAAEQSTYNDVRAQGVIVVAAAGNDAVSTPFYPASYNNVGSNVDIAAPGGDSGDIDGDGNIDYVLSTCGQNKDGTIIFNYCYLPGTSMASPHVAGVMALMKSANPAITPAQVDQLLASGSLTEDIGAAGRDDDFGNGLVDARKAVIAAQGATPPPTPAIMATPRSLNFNAADSTLELVLSNSGTGTLQVTSVTSSVAWIAVSRGTVDANGVGRYSLRVTRTGMADGTYSAQIDIASNAGALRVPVVIQVKAGPPLASNAGYHYVLLIDPDSGDTAYEVPVAASNGFYTYRFDNVANGTYELFAGSDADNDGEICDEGEACGAYLTTDQPTTVTVDRNRTLMDFVSGFDVSIRSQAANAPSSNPARVLRRLQPKSTN
jgi:serine protease